MWPILSVFCKLLSITSINQVMCQAKYDNPEVVELAYVLYGQKITFKYVTVRSTSVLPYFTTALWASSTLRYQNIDSR